MDKNLKTFSNPVTNNILLSVYRDIMRKNKALKESAVNISTFGECM